MSDTYLLSCEALSTLEEKFAQDAHFMSIALPRLKIIAAMADLLGDQRLEWKVKYSPVNRSANGVIISLKDPRKKFLFYYAIPLSLGLNVHLYLGDNTFNFFEAHPLLIKQGVIAAEEYPVAATVNTLPHLVLNDKNERYEQGLLRASHCTPAEVQGSRLYKVLENAFAKFNPVLLAIIDGNMAL
ncbi:MULTISPECIES: hypothetical protein [unclassified Carboxylicivirga]|uniref:hypothetical protein n=1 Tax=Carboxylicivirga TaxID=1628153 RepID=UPI003D345503